MYFHPSLVYFIRHKLPGHEVAKYTRVKLEQVWYKNSKAKVTALANLVDLGLKVRLNGAAKLAIFDHEESRYERYCNSLDENLPIACHVTGVVDGQELQISPLDANRIGYEFSLDKNSKFAIDEVYSALATTSSVRT